MTAPLPAPTPPAPTPANPPRRKPERGDPPPNGPTCADLGLSPEQADRLAAAVPAALRELARKHLGN